MEAVLRDSVLIDTQFNIDRSGCCFIKELGIMSLDETCPKHYLMKPPHMFHLLSKRLQRQNLYNTRNINAIEWASGDVDIFRLPEILQEYNNADRIVYVKGLGKQTELQKYLPKACIVDLGDSFSLRDVRNYVHNCPYHCSSFSRCVINNLFKMKFYLEKKYIRFINEK